MTQCFERYHSDTGNENSRQRLKLDVSHPAPVLVTHSVGFIVQVWPCRKIIKARR